MSTISREHLHAYLDDALDDSSSARVEKALRDSPALLKQLQLAMMERDRGEHTLGAIWRRNRMSCPSREQLGSYLLQVLDEPWMDYLKFHLETLGCPYCQANLADLQASQKEPGRATKQRRRRFFETSANLLRGKDK